MVSNFIYIVAIICAEYMYAHNLPRRPYYILRLAVGITASVAIAVLLPVYESFWYSCLVYVLLFTVRLLFMKLTYKEDWINLVFCGLAAYTTQHFAYQFVNLVILLICRGQEPLFGIYHTSVIDFTKFGLDTVFWAILYIICYFSVYLFAYALFACKIKKGSDLKIKNKTLLALIGFCVVINIVLNSVIIYSGEEQTFLNSVIRCIYGMICCLFLLQWQFGLVYTRQLEFELDFIKNLLSKEKAQYKLAKENIDIINMKCHDMRHQIRNIGAMRKLSGEALEEIENSISIYDSCVKTGNDALDVILTEKNLFCLKHGVILSCIADGNSLGFMQGSDIYSLFGNALDNAIEAVNKLSEKEKRVIGLKVIPVGDMVTINVRNFYGEELKFDGKTGLPQTTKKNTDVHGYGMKSIKYIVQKYEGSLSVRADGGIFSLDILFSGRRAD